MAAENGYVPTPPAVADYAAAVAFGIERPSEVEGGGRLLLPGFGDGNLYQAAMRYCTEGENWYVPQFDYPQPECVGVENDPELVADAPTEPGLSVHHADFLTDPPTGPFDWVLANPPYSRYSNIPEHKRDQYRDTFDLASGQFPLHVLFLEQSLRLLKPGGNLAFLLPLSVLGAESIEPLRERLRALEVGPIMYLPPESFDETVEVAIFGVRNRVNGAHPLWLEALYGYEVELLLDELGVDDIEAARKNYRDEFKRHHEFVMHAEHRRRRRSGGVSADTQAELGVFAAGRAD